MAGNHSIQSVGLYLHNESSISLRWLPIGSSSFPLLELNKKDFGTNPGQSSIATNQGGDTNPIDKACCCLLTQESCKVEFNSMTRNGCGLG